MGGSVSSSTCGGVNFGSVGCRLVVSIGPLRPSLRLRQRPIYKAANGLRARGDVVLLATPFVDFCQPLFRCSHLKRTIMFQRHVVLIGHVLT